MSLDLQMVAPEPDFRWNSNSLGSSSSFASYKSKREDPRSANEFRDADSTQQLMSKHLMHSTHLASNKPEQKSVPNDCLASIQWTQLRKLSTTIFPTLSPFGRPTTFAGCQNYIFVGTYSGDILVFDYEQKLVAQLSARKNTDFQLGVVTSLSLSSDETRLLAGFGLGAVVIWDISRVNIPHMLSIVLPQTRIEPMTKFEQNETHIAGIPVIQCGILGNSPNWNYVSVDASGVVIAHQRRRLILEFHTKSRRILGDPRHKQEVFSCCITEHYLALITANQLVVADIRLEFGVLNASIFWQIPRFRDTAAFDDVKHACLQICGSVLLYSWNLQVKLLDLNTKSAEMGFSVPFIVKNSDFVTPDLLVVLGDRDMALIKLTNESNKFLTLQTIGIGSSKIIKAQVLFNSLFVMGEHEFKVGKLANWADQLMLLLNRGKPSYAIEFAYELYRDESDLAVLGLPSSPKHRRMIIAKTLPDIVLSAVHFSVQYDEESLRQLLPVAIKVSSVICSGILENIEEICEESLVAKNVFLEELRQLVLDKHITKLPPALFKQLVSRFVDPQLFYNLDLSTLDLDLAFKLCSKYENVLIQVEVYLESQALHDYVAPLKTTNPKIDVYEYLRLILTGRAFPTEESMSLLEADNAKAQLYDALFLRDSNELCARLSQKNPEMFFQALHEGFEEPWLNDNQEINRQVIMNMLLVIADTTSIYFADFIARNYPKYSQFLTLSDMTLNQVVDTLCSSPLPEKFEAFQLSLISLLSVYKPSDNARLIQKLVSVKFVLVLQHVLRRQRKLLDLARYELKLASSDVWKTLSESFSQNLQSSLLFIQNNWDELLNFDSSELGRFVVRQQVEFWAFGVDMSSNLDFLRAVFTEIGLNGGKIPPHQVRSDYICLLARTTTLTDDSSDDLLMYTLKHILPGSHDIQLPFVVESLIENNRIDALTLLLCRLERNQEALIYIRNYISENDLSSQELAKYVDLACNILCEDTSGGLEIWKQLLGTLSDRGFSDQVQKVVHRITKSSNNTLSEVLELLLHETLGIDVAPTISLIYTSMIRQEQELRCFYSIIQRDNLTDILDLVTTRKQGWVIPVDGECEICGLKIVGLGINAQKLYEAWEIRKIKDYWGAKDCSAESEKISNDNLDKLILFQCGHSYHYVCLNKMCPKLNCIVCQDQ